MIFFSVHAFILIVLVSLFYLAWLNVDVELSGGIGQERLIHLMHEVFSRNLDLRNGESILSMRLIFHEGLCLMKMVITIAVLLFLFL